MPTPVAQSLSQASDTACRDPEISMLECRPPQCRRPPAALEDKHGPVPAVPFPILEDNRSHESQSLLPAALRMLLARDWPGRRQDHLWTERARGTAGLRSERARQARYRRPDGLT